MTYYANGGTGSPPVDVLSPYQSGSAVTIMNKGNLEFAGRSFIGWTLHSSGEGTVYLPGQAFIIESNVAFYAKWSASPTLRPTITSIDLPDGNINVRYSATVEAIGTDPITWSVTSGLLPDGLFFTTNGLISGTPTTSGVYKFTVKAQNAYGSDTREFIIEIGVAKIIPEITGVETLTLPKGYAKTSTAKYTITGTEPLKVEKISGNARITWNDGAQKLDIDAGLGVGSYPVKLRASNDAGAVEFIFTFIVVETYNVYYHSPLSDFGLPPVDKRNYLFDEEVTVLGKQTLVRTDYTFIGWNTQENGKGISYRPAATFKIYTDINLYAQWSDRVEPPVICTPPLPVGYVGLPYSVTLDAIGTDPITWSIEGSLPSGLTLTDDKISGTPTKTVKTSAFVLIASNEAGEHRVPFSITIDVTEAPAITGPSSMHLPLGYSATFSDEFTVTGTEARVSKKSGDAKIVWIAASRTLSIDKGLEAGVYPVVLAAGNGVDPDAMFTFTLTVGAQKPYITPQTTKIEVVVNGYSVLSVRAYSIDGGGLSYQWYKSASGTKSARATELTGVPIAGQISDTYIVPTDETGTFYYYCVVTNRANDGSTASTTSDIFTVIVTGGEVTGEQTPGRLEAKIYPNPVDAGAKFTVQLEPTGHHALIVELYSSSGALLQKTETTETQFLLTAPQATGVYLLRITRGATSIAYQLVVQ